MTKLKVIQLDFDRSFTVETAEKNDDGSIETESGVIAISPAAVFPTGGDTFVPDLETLCNMPTPPPVLKAKNMAVLAFQGDYLPIEHVTIYDGGSNHQQRSRYRAIAHTRIARHEVGQKQSELTAQQRQMSDTFHFMWKVVGAGFVISVIAIVFVLSQQGGGG